MDPLVPTLGFDKNPLVKPDGKVVGNGVEKKWHDKKTSV
jgi:hypothetical protein